MRTLAFCLATVTALASASAKDLPLSGRATLSVQMSFGERSYEAYIPTSAPTRRAPLVIALHGLGGDGANIIAQGRWDTAADRHGFIVLGPDGTTQRSDSKPRFRDNPRSWNAGPLTGSPAAERGIDDIGFIRRLIDEWVSAGRVDPDRVYVTGFSNGAGMAFRAGAEISDKIAAIAPVSNALLVSVDQLSRPVSLVMFWGEADPLNPFEGGKVKRTGGSVERPGARASLDRWKTLLACSDRAEAQPLGRTVSRVAYRDCAGGSEAELYAIRGMGHQWPSGQVALRLISGPGSNAVDATETIWSFFERHARSSE